MNLSTFPPTIEDADILTNASNLIPPPILHQIFSWL